ncbi:MAG: ATP-dependent DNA ligase [Terriglobia bacterium]
MQRFAETCEAVAATAKKTEKVRRVAGYLCSLPVEDAARAAIFFTGRAFPRCEERTLEVGGAQLWQTVAQLSGADEEAMARVYRQHGDLGAMAAELLATHGPDPPPLRLADVADAFEELSRARGPSQKLPRLEALLRRAQPLEAKYILKIITTELRIGLRENLVEEAVAVAYEAPLAAIRRAAMLSGDIGLTVHLTVEGKLDEAQLRLYHPIDFMLASPAETPAEAMEYFPEEALVEDKYDGIRAQAHKREQQVRLFSRTLDDITPQFPEFVPALAALPGNFVLDGEVLGWKQGRALPFNELQKRLGRKQPDTALRAEVPVALIAFDLLFRDGILLLDTPLERRRRELAALLASSPSEHLQLAAAHPCRSAQELEQAFTQALARGNEGVMAKAPGSLYVPGRRGKQWLKLKRPLATLDVVVTAVEYGHGKRRGWLSDYTFAVRDGERLLNIGKAYSGLTDAEIQRLTHTFKQHVLEDQGFRLLVAPQVVLEVAFNNLQRSRRHASGFALRFPRIVRLRPDKAIEQIDTLARVQELFAQQAGRNQQEKVS